MSGDVIPLRRHDLEEGDCVRLKSGGPNMLVAIADAEIERLVMCIWFGGGPRGRRRFQAERFDPATLDVVAKQTR